MDLNPKDFIWKDMRFIEPADPQSLPMKGRIVAIDIHDRIITEYDELPDQVFCDAWMENFVFEKPDEIPDEIEVRGVKYKRVF